MNSRRKGKVGEREFAALLRTHPSLEERIAALQRAA